MVLLLLLFLLLLVLLVLALVLVLVLVLLNRRAVVAEEANTHVHVLPLVDASCCEAPDFGMCRPTLVTDGLKRGPEVVGNTRVLNTHNSNICHKGVVFLTAAAVACAKKGARPIASDDGLKRIT